MTSFMIKYFIVSISIFLVVVLGYLIFYAKQKTKTTYFVESSVSNRKIKRRYSLYAPLSKLPILGMILTNLKKRLQLSATDNEYMLRAKSVTILFLALSIGVIGSITCIILFGNDLYSVCMIILLAIYSIPLIINLLIPTEIKLLKEMIGFIEETKHQFHLHGVVSESIYQATKKSPHMMNLHGNKIYEVLQSTKENAIDEYNKNCPNKFLKLFLGLSILTKQYGDGRTENNLSIYIKQLNYLLEEIKLEIIKRDKMEYRLKALTTIAIIPPFLAKPFSTWLIANFDMTAAYYNSTKGFISQVLIIISTFFTYILLKQLEAHNSPNSSKLVVKEKHWEEKILKVKFLYKLVQKMKPKAKSKTFFRIRDLLQESGTYLTMDWLYLRRVISVAAVFIVLTSVTVGYHKISTSNILNDSKFGIQNPKYYEMLGIMGDKSKDKQLEDSVSIDKDIISSQKYGKQVDRKSIVDKVSAAADLSDSQKTIIIERITKKAEKLNTEHMKWYEIVVILLIAIISVDIPILMLRFEKAFRKGELEEEVHQFNTIILLLKENKSISIPMILEWMEKFADMYYNPIKTCSNNLQKGIVTALKELQQEVKYPTFTRLIDNLIAAENIKIKQAFDSLETEREFYKDERKEMNRRIVNTRVTWSKLIAYIPATVTLGTYLVLPMLWTSFTQLSDLMLQLTKTS